MNLLEYKNLIDGKPMHIATINIANNPNKKIIPIIIPLPPKLYSIIAVI